LDLRVSDNRRFLVHADGRPFFWLGDTAWELFHRLDRADADVYLRTRAAQGFTVIQAVVLAEHEYQRPNAYGALPLVDHDPTRPVEAYFEHVDWIVRRAAELGLTIGLLPTWGDKWNRKWGQGPECFTPANAAVFGEFLGRRYREQPVIWILGGDRPVENDTHRAIIEATAQGLAAGDGGRHLMTFHPCGQQTSSQYFHQRDWLALNMYQTGHTRDRDNWRSIRAEYALTPVKPCLDGEPGYEDHPSGFKAENGYLDEHDVRRSCYWALFAGACGHTYGCHDIWQFLSPQWAPVTSPRTPWPKALHFAGAWQMRHARRLLELRPYLSRIPDAALIAGPAGEGCHHIEATRDADGSWAMVYFGAGDPALIDLGRLSAKALRITWYDPRTGAATVAGEMAGGGTHLVGPPSSGRTQDWVLLLDDVARGYRVP